MTLFWLKLLCNNLRNDPNFLCLKMFYSEKFFVQKPFFENSLNIIKMTISKITKTKICHRKYENSWMKFEHSTSWQPYRSPTKNLFLTNWLTHTKLYFPFPFNQFVRWFRMKKKLCQVDVRKIAYLCAVHPCIRTSIFFFRLKDFGLRR